MKKLLLKSMHEKVVDALGIALALSVQRAQQWDRLIWAVLTRSGGLSAFVFQTVDETWIH